MDLDLDGSSAFVAAASSGLGRAAATQLAAGGANVMISSRSEENLAEAREAILAETGRTDSVAAVTVNLDDKEAIRDGVAAAVDRFGRLDILVMNHGAWRTRRSWRRHWTTSTTGIGEFFGAQSSL